MMVNRANIILTNNCNLRCLHCYIDAKKCNEDYKDIFKRTKLLVNRLHNDRINNIMFTGGECMIFPFLKEIIEYSKSLGIVVTIFTNGMIFNKEIYDLVDFVNLSIDGNRKTHNYIRQNEHSYDNILRVLDYLKEKDIKTTVQMTINDMNINELDDMADLIINYLNIRTVKIVMTSNIGRAKKNKISNDINNIQKIFDKIDDLYAKTQYHIQFIPNVINNYDFDNYYLEKRISFPVWFDVPNREYYVFSKNFYKDKIENYSYDSVSKKNNEVFELIKENVNEIKKSKFIILEDELDKIVK